MPGAKAAPMHTPICVTCQHQMEPGFIPDLGRSAIYQAIWYPGEPQGQEDKLLGFNLAPEGAVEVDLGEGKPITSFRCVNCGRLELFAP